jgi:hypothetical protein
MNPVTIKIRDNNKSIQISWEANMNVKDALEKAYNQEKEQGRKFDFAIRYFGYSQNNGYLGYLVIMIDEFLDNPNDLSDPYWWYYINGQPAQVGIDSYVINAGDTIEFDYTPYNDDQHKNSINEAKLNHYHNK